MVFGVIVFGRQRCTNRRRKRIEMGEGEKDDVWKTSRRAGYRQAKKVSKCMGKLITRVRRGIKMKHKRKNIFVFVVWMSGCMNKFG